MTRDLRRRDLLAAAAALGAGSGLGVGIAAASPPRAEGTCAPAAGTSADAALAAELVAHARELEAAEVARDPDRYASLVAADYSEIAPHFATTLKGRDTARRLQEFAKAAPQRIACSFIDRPVVNVFGELALLLYISLRLVRDGAGRTDPACRRVTRVYAKRAGKWELVHTHSSSFDYRSTW